MGAELTQNQLRVLGCLIEKQLATPEYYPLTLSALVNACNQKSNRNPVLSLTENDVLDAIQELSQKNLAREKQMPHARVAKYEHKLSDTLTKQYDFSQKELAVLAELMLRGPQTAGELRSRCSRMHNFVSLEEVDETLHILMENKSQAYVKALARQPGRREIRFTHLFAEFEGESLNSDASNFTQSTNYSAQPSELDELRHEVVVLRTEVDELKRLVQTLIN